jgi:putative endonuclease
MKTNMESGKDGELKAVNYLKEKGWKILVQNYRHKRGELDIIALDKEVLVFVEVKFRKNNDFGFPEDFVNDHKVGMIRKTAVNYLVKQNWHKDIRFDIISITGENDPEHFEDAF